MRHRLPSLNALRAFEAAGRCMSITRAADDLCVSAGAVSRQVKLLEGYFNASLFVRAQQGLEFTPKGKAYYAAIKPAFDQIDAASDKLLGKRELSALRISAYTTFVSDWLLSRLPKFWRDYPEISISVNASMRENNILADDFDIVITTKNQEQEGLHKQFLFNPQYFPVCSPEYLKAHGPIEAEEDLIGHRLLSSTIQVQNMGWQTWFESAGLGYQAFDLDLVLETSSCAYKAAREGIGVALGQQIFLQDDIEQGVLVEPFSTRFKSNNSYYLICRRSQRNDRAMKVFKKWISEEISKCI